MTYQKRKELESFSMGVVSPRKSYEKKEPEDDAQELTLKEFEDLEDFLDDKVNDYIKNTIEPKIKEIFEIIGQFKKITLSPGNDINGFTEFEPYYFLAKLYNGTAICVSKENTQYKVAFDNELRKKYDYINGRLIGEHLDKIIEENCGIKKCKVHWVGCDTLKLK